LRAIRLVDDSSALSVAQVGPVHPPAQHGDLMPESEDLGLLVPVTAPEQDQELKDTAEDQVQDRPEHEQRGCPLREHARAMNLQLNSADPGFRTPQAARGSHGALPPRGR